MTRPSAALEGIAQHLALELGVLADGRVDAVELPDGDGLTIVRELRRAGSRTPAICLSARDRVEEQVEGLYGGADDYLVKPSFRGATEIHLTAQEFALLRYLAEHRGRVLSRTRILDAVWGVTHDPRTNVVDVYVSYLRAKIDPAADRRSAPLCHPGALSS